MRTTPVALEHEETEQYINRPAAVHNSRMATPQAFLNGQFIAADQLRIAAYDAGFVLGATISEQMRTFGGRLFRLEEHLRRLEQGLAIAEIEPGCTIESLAAAAEQLAARNHALLEAGDDLGLSLFVTPGPYPTLAGDAPRLPTVAMHTYPLPFANWQRAYASGVPLVRTSVLQAPGESIPSALKCRSRMHYFLADKQARRQRPDARALLFDAAGNVSETSTANVLVYRAEEGLISPPFGNILRGITLDAVLELAAAAGIATRQRDLSAGDVHTADEVLLTSTPSCLLPATSFDEQPIGGGQPGPLFQSLLAAFNELARLDIAVQASRFATRATA